MIITKEDNFFLVKILKEFIPEFNIYDKDSFMELFKSILIELEQKYQLNGLFDIDVYMHSDYGIIMEVNSLEPYFDGIDLFGEMDVRIHFHIGSIFMSEVDSQDILNYEDIYYYHDKFYTIYHGLVDSNIIYKDCDKIIEEGIKVY